MTGEAEREIGRYRSADLEYSKGREPRNPGDLWEMDKARKWTFLAH